MAEQPRSEISLSILRVAPAAELPEQPARQVPDIRRAPVTFAQAMVPVLLGGLCGWGCNWLFRLFYSGSVADMVLFVPHILVTFVGGIVGLLAGFWLTAKKDRVALCPEDRHLSHLSK